MAFTKQRFALFYSLPLSEADFSNLTRSRVRLIVMPLGIAYRSLPTMRRLHDMGVSVVLRCEDNNQTVAGIVNMVQAIQNVCNVDSLILPFNEIDAGVSMDWGQAWQNKDAEAHARNVESYRIWLKSLLPGMPLIAPALSAQIKSEHSVKPGYLTWRELISPIYNRCSGVSVHLYLDNYASIVDELRLEWLLSLHCSMWHQTCYISELGFYGEDAYPLTDVQRAAGYVATANKILTRPQWASRINLLCPFTANGVPTSWPERYILKSPEAYKVIGDWMT